jgi:hypothetical protein
MLSVCDISKLTASGRLKLITADGGVVEDETLIVTRGRRGQQTQPAIRAAGGFASV